MDMQIYEAIEDIQKNIQPVVGGRSLELAIEALRYLEMYRAQPKSEVSLDYKREYEHQKTMIRDLELENQDYRIALLKVALRLK